MRGSFKKPSDIVVRLKEEANSLRNQARGMPSGVRRDELLRTACQIETIALVNERGMISPGSKPRK